MDNQRVLRRTTLRAKNLPARARIEGVSGQAVNGFGRHCDQLPPLQLPGKKDEVSLGAGEDACLASFHCDTKKAGGCSGLEKREDARLLRETATYCASASASWSRRADAWQKARCTSAAGSCRCP